MRLQYGNTRSFDRSKAAKTRIIPFVFSTTQRDRHGTVVSSNWNLDSFRNNPIVGYMHNVYGGGICNDPDPDQVIGIAKNVYVDGRGWLLGDIEFEPEDINPLADKIFRKCLAGSLKACSVGFAEIGEGKYGEGREAPDGEEPTYYFAGQELLEVSIVPIPSNPQSLARDMRNQSAGALMKIRELLGGGISFAEIEKMTVKEVADRIEGKLKHRHVKPMTQLQRRLAVYRLLNN